MQCEKQEIVVNTHLNKFVRAPERVVRDAMERCRVKALGEFLFMYYDCMEVRDILNKNPELEVLAYKELRSRGFAGESLFPGEEN